jgi:GNAT superfamily N-acetyltransferase
LLNSRSTWTSAASSAILDAYRSFPDWLNHRPPDFDVSGALAAWDAILLVRGPAQSGKSSFLRALASETSTALGLSMCQLHGREPIIDLLDGDVSDRVHLLARLRVSDPGSLLAPYDELSTSEQFSVALAVWFSRGEPVLILDDFARSFDAVTRRALARILGRECRSRGVRLAVSTSEAEEIVDDLAPDCIVTLSEPGDMRIELPAITNLPEFGFAVEPGTIDDFKKLSHLHYHGSLDLDPNSTDTWIFKASYDGELAGVRVFAAPYPRQWERLDYLFGHINQRMCIAHRIVVHPLYRGLGVGRLLSAKSLFPRKPCCHGQHYPIYRHSTIPAATHHSISV